MIATPPLAAAQTPAIQRASTRSHLTGYLFDVEVEVMANNSSYPPKMGSQAELLIGSFSYLRKRTKYYQ